MLTVVLADSELELVPLSIAGHPAVRTSAKKRGRSPTSSLLDSSHHHPALKGDLTAVIGGFPHGGFRSPVAKLCDRVCSLHEGPLKAWTVAAELLVAYCLFSKRRVPKRA